MGAAIASRKPKAGTCPDLSHQHWEQELQSFIFQLNHNVELSFSLSEFMQGLGSALLAPGTFPFAGASPSASFVKHKESIATA